jgi:hypothetical protein
MSLTNEQIQAIREGEPVPLVPPEVGQECVLVRRDVYERLVRYDDLPPSDEELARLGWEAGKSIGWDTPEMAEYDNYDQEKLP